MCTLISKSCHKAAHGKSNAWQSYAMKDPRKDVAKFDHYNYL